LKRNWDAFVQIASRVNAVATLGATLVVAHAFQVQLDRKTMMSEAAPNSPVLQESYCKVHAFI
jgi:hypothetical protein